MQNLDSLRDLKVAWDISLSPPPLIISVASSRGVQGYCSSSLFSFYFREFKLIDVTDTHKKKYF